MDTSISIHVEFQRAAVRPSALDPFQLYANAETHEANLIFFFVYFFE